MQYATHYPARLCAIASALFLITLLSCLVPNQGRTTRTSIRDWEDSVVAEVQNVYISNDEGLSEPVAVGRSEQEVATGTEVETFTNTSTVAHLSEDTQAVKNDTGSVAQSEETTAEEQQETKSTETGRTRIRTGSTVTTTSSVVSKHSSTRIVRLPEAVNRTEEELEKRISDALSGALFEAGEGGDVKIEAKQTTDIITSAFADLLVAAGASAESLDDQEICEEVMTKVGPQAVTASIRSALEVYMGSDLPPEVEDDLRKLERASVSVEGSTSTSACASLGKSDAEGLLTAAAYDETISSIVEDILIEAGETKRSSDVESESMGGFTDVHTESTSSSEGIAGSSTEQEGGVEAESVKGEEKEETGSGSTGTTKAEEQMGMTFQRPSRAEEEVFGQEGSTEEEFSEGEGQEQEHQAETTTQVPTEQERKTAATIPPYKSPEDIWSVFPSPKQSVLVQPQSSSIKEPVTEPAIKPREPSEGVGSVTVCNDKSLVRCCQTKRLFCTCGRLDDGSMCTAKLVSSGATTIYDIRSGGIKIIDRCRCP